MTQVHLCAIGDEVLDGRTLNTNSCQLAKFFTQQGYEITRHTTLPDKIEAFQEFYNKEDHFASIIVTCGGLGPTEDDRTRTALSESFGWTFETDKQWLEYLEKNWRKVDTALLSQAQVPRGAFVLENDHGTACGFIKKEGEKYFIFLPGVPQECLGMLPKIENYFKNHFTWKRQKEFDKKIKIFGIYERVINDTLRKIQLESKTNFSWGLYPSYCEVKVHLKSPLEEDLKKAFDAFEKLYAKNFYQTSLCQDFLLELDKVPFEVVFVNSRPLYHLQWLFALCSTQEPDQENLLEGFKKIHFVDREKICASAPDFQALSTQNRKIVLVKLQEPKEKTSFRWELILKVLENPSRIHFSQNSYQATREIVTSSTSYADQKVNSWLMGELLQALRSNFSY